MGLKYKNNKFKLTASKNCCSGRDSCSSGKSGCCKRNLCLYLNNL